MVDWKEYRITSIRRYGSNPGSVEIEVDGRVDFKGNDRGVYGKIRASFVNCPPCDSLRVGDYIEIDLDYTRTQPFNMILENTSAIRKVDSTALVPHSSFNQQITSNQIQEREERMRRWVEESCGEYEVDFIARQEHRTDGSISAREMKWTYRRK